MIQCLNKSKAGVHFLPPILFPSSHACSPDHVAAICVEDPPGWEVGGGAAASTESTEHRRDAAGEIHGSVTAGRGSGQDRNCSQTSSLAISMSRCAPLLWERPVMPAQHRDQLDAFVLGCSL